MGVPGSAPYAALLNQLARDGNTARSQIKAATDAGSGDDGGDSGDDANHATSGSTPAPTTPAPTTPAPTTPAPTTPAPTTDYYAVDSTDLASFTAAMSAIAASITATCTLTLNTAPEDSPEVNVFIDEKVLPQQGDDDGWTLDGQTVTILGKSCQEILSGAVLDVRVVAGCPTVAC